MKIYKISQDTKKIHPMERIETIAEKYGWKVIYHPNPNTVKIAGGDYPTLISEDGLVKIALDATSIFTRPDRTDIYLGSPSNFNPNKITLAGLIVDPSIRGTKRASQAVESLKQIANELNMSIAAEPTPIISATPKGTPKHQKGLNHDQLIKFYKRHGWTPRTPNDNRILDYIPTNV